MRVFLAVVLATAAAALNTPTADKGVTTLAPRCSVPHIWPHQPRVREGSRVTLICEGSTGDVTWTRDKEQFGGTEWRRGENVSSVLRPLVNTNTSFQCHPSGPCSVGNRTSSSVHVLVYPRGKEPTGMPVITEGPEARVFTLASSKALWLPCRAQGSPTPEVHWLRNGRLIEPARGLFIFNSTGSLVIENVTPADSGEYQCWVRNSHGFAFSNFTELRVTPAVSETSEVVGVSEAAVSLYPSALALGALLLLMVTALLLVLLRMRALTNPKIHAPYRGYERVKVQD